MAIPELERQLAEALLTKFCANKVPARFHDKVRLEFATRGNLITLFDRRPVWNDPQAEWTKLKVAQFEWLPRQNLWRLKYTDRNGKWHAYDDKLAPQKKFAALLKEVNEDPTCIFWG